MWHGGGLDRVQTFLLNSLKPSTIRKYIAVLEQLNSDLTEQNVDWGHLTDDQKDDFLAEWVLSGYEQGLGKAEFSWGLSAVQKIFPRLRIKTAWRVLDTWGLLVPVHQAPGGSSRAFAGHGDYGPSVEQTTTEFSHAVCLCWSSKNP